MVAVLTIFSATLVVVIASTAVAIVVSLGRIMWQDCLRGRVRRVLNAEYRKGWWWGRYATKPVRLGSHTKQQDMAFWCGFGDGETSRPLPPSSPPAVPSRPLVQP